MQFIQIGELAITRRTLPLESPPANGGLSSRWPGFKSQTEHSSEERSDGEKSARSGIWITETRAERGFASGSNPGRSTVSERVRTDRTFSTAGFGSSRFRGVAPVLSSEEFAIIEMSTDR